MAGSSATKIQRKGVSTALKRIALRPQDLETAAQLEKQFELSPVAARVLAARGFKADEDLEHYITPTLKSGLPDPKKLKNLKEACALVRDVVAADGSVAICCDFDVDGLSGGSQLHHFLKSAGIKSKVFVPDRFKEGYGLNQDMIRKIAELGFALVITVDYGTTNQTEIALARELGLKTIVIDHHHVGSHDPGADVFINPQQQDCGFADGTLCAAGLVWFFLIGLRAALPQAKSLNPKDYLDLACLGTICDMVPLRGANRIIAKRGLELLGRTRRPGLVALKNAIGIGEKVKCSNVSFGIGPRINAAGRMVHGEVVIELLTSDDSRKCDKLAKKLNRLNKERQDLESRIKAEAIAQVEEFTELPWGIVVWEEDFHTGVIGIVAQRMVEQFYRPAAVLGADDDGIYKGSVRGIKGFSVIEALNSVGDLLVKFGGHEGAGGFSIEKDKIPKFVEAFQAECKKRLADIPTEPFADADTKAGILEIDIPLINELQNFAPFGVGNPGPLIMLENLRVTEVKILKDAHLKATLSDSGRYIAGLMWHATEHPELRPGAKVNVACRLDLNTYNGVTEIQAHLQAVEPACTA